MNSFDETTYSKQIDAKISSCERFRNKLEIQSHLFDYKLQITTFIEQTEYIILMHLTLLNNLDVLNKDDIKELYDQAKTVLDSMTEDIKELKNIDEEENNIYQECIYVLKYFIKEIEML